MKFSYLQIILLLLLVAGCRKTADFYATLDNLPRADKLFSNAYAVGDTLILSGKFGAGNAVLSIKIGDIDAPVISLVTHDSVYIQNDVRYNYTSDQIKMLITEPMIGPQQPVVATVNGNSSTVATILVTQSRSLPARADTLSCMDDSMYRIALQMPEGTRVIPNYAPGAAIVFVNGDSIISWQEGTIRRGKVAWRDNSGDFSILDPLNAGYGFATDPAGNNLYISCLTSDAQLPGATHSAIRLIKVSLQDYSVTTLNRTVLPTSTGLIEDSYLDLDTVKREGDIGQVFLPVMKNIYVNSKGELYFSGPSFNWYAADGIVYSNVTTNLTVARLNSSGSFQYLAKGAVYESKIFQVYMIKDGMFNMEYDYIPNTTTVFNYDRLLSIDAENGLLYGYTGVDGGSLYAINTFHCYNLTLQRQLSELTYKKVANGPPTISDGPFNIVEGNYTELSSGTRIFQWPAPGQPMVIFAIQQQYQGSGRFEYQWQGADNSVYNEIFSVKMINFATRNVSTYAPFLYASPNGLPAQLDPANPGHAFYLKYSMGMGGDVIGYTTSQLPVMLRNREIDPSINQVLLMEPIR